MEKKQHRRTCKSDGIGGAFLSGTVVFLDHMDVNGPKDVDFADETLYISETSTGISGLADR